MWDRRWEGLWCSFAPADSYLPHQTALLAAQRSSTYVAANSVALCCSFALKTHAVSSRKGTRCSVLVRGLSWEGALIFLPNPLQRLTLKPNQSILVFSLGAVGVFYLLEERERCLHNCSFYYVHRSLCWCVFTSNDLHTLSWLRLCLSTLSLKLCCSVLLSITLQLLWYTLTSPAGTLHSQ